MCACACDTQSRAVCRLLNLLFRLPCQCCRSPTCSDLASVSCLTHSSNMRTYIHRQHTRLAHTWTTHTNIYTSIVRKFYWALQCSGHSVVAALQCSVPSGHCKSGWPHTYAHAHAHAHTHTHAQAYAHAHVYAHAHAHKAGGADRVWGSNDL